MTDTLEVRLLRWSDNSTGGQTVTFLLPESEVHPFKGLRFGKTGERFAMALARIEDEETKADHVFPDGYVDGSKPEKTEGEKAVIRAVMLCKDASFKTWAGNNCLPTETKLDTTRWARSVILFECGISSRRELATNPEALKKFLALETDFKYRDTRR